MIKSASKSGANSEDGDGPGQLKELNLIKTRRAKAD